jgi:hypothetical protein
MARTPYLASVLEARPSVGRSFAGQPIPRFGLRMSHPNATAGEVSRPNLLIRVGLMMMRLSCSMLSLGGNDALSRVSGGWRDRDV